MGSTCWSNVWEEQLLVVGSEESAACHGAGRTAQAPDFDDGDDDVDVDDDDFEADDPDFDVSLEDEEEEGDADAVDYEDEDAEDEAVSGGRRRGGGR